MTTVFSRDTQLKTMESTLSNAEKYMGQFCTLLAAYTRKTAKLRDKADTLVRQLHEFACTGDPEMSICLKNFSEDLAMVQDYRQAQVERLETRVITPLKAYGDIVKAKRADLKTFGADRKREVKELQRLETIRLSNPADRQGISQAEVNVQKASSYANRSTQQMEDIIIDFQRHKLEDIKRIFREFIMVEMLFHAKAVEVYTHTFKNMETMDIDKDLQVFRNRIQLSESLLENTTSTIGMPLYPSSSPTTLRPPHYPSPTPSVRRTTQPQSKQSLGRIPVGHRETADDEEEEEVEEEEERYISEDDLSEPQLIRRSYAAEYDMSAGETATLKVSVGADWKTKRVKPPLGEVTPACQRAFTDCSDHYALSCLYVSVITFKEETWSSLDNCSWTTQEQS